MDAIRNRVLAALRRVGELRRPYGMEIEKIWIRPGDYSFGERIFKEEGDWEPFLPGQTWGGADRHFWFKAQIQADERWKGRQVRARVLTGATDIWNTDNPQIMAYVNGRLTGTLDMNHQEVILTENCAGEETFDLGFYAYSNSRESTNFFALTAAVLDEETEGLYYDLKVAFEAADLLGEEELCRIEAFKVLNEALLRLDLRRPHSPQYQESVQKTRAYLKENYYDRLPENPVTVHGVGHTHIDVAWKWPLRQTRQKAVRSFQTVVSLMERYPEYRFMSSQPQLYEFVKEEAPELYEKVKKRIAEGRWEAEGAMWLEPDCNLASGESLIRHILYGRHFFEDELKAEPCEVLWLPDVFGYSAAMPQIMRKSGLKYFMTTKLGWNEYNRFPYDTFTWQGIDGSQVLSYLITTSDYVKEGKRQSNETTYNGLNNPSQVMGTWQRYQNKDVSRDVLSCYGYGDGGGGPTEEMLEQARRLKRGGEKCPNLKQSFVKEFFHTLEEKMDRRRLPVWSGELYLEFHRGTYTSMAKNKWYNRRCEFLCGDGEFYSVFAAAAGAGFAYPQEALEKNWKLLLLNQFHDILPGTAIREVYEDSWEQYEEILQTGEKLVREAKEAAAGALCLGEGKGLLVWNSLSFGRQGLVELSREEAEGCGRLGLPGQETAEGTFLYLAEAPAKGFGFFGGDRAQEEMAAQPGPVIEEMDLGGDAWTIRTPYYEASLDQNGAFSRLFDRRAGRELLPKGEAGNRLEVYEDRPLEFDAWNIDAAYREQMWDIGGAARRIKENGPVRAVISVKRRFMDSEICQDICFYRHTARIDFKTQVEWRESQLLLKAAFPLDMNAAQADYEIQFGNVKRPTHENTAWDQARFEVCAHKWADLSEYGYGAALLNDCKYGYDIHNHVMRLTLIKSGIFPNPQADQGLHVFTYALFPHKGDFREGDVIREAYSLNCPLNAQPALGAYPGRCSFMELSEPNILADTVKLAQDGDGVIVRMYEAWGKRTRVRVSFPMAFGTAEAVCRPRAWECGCIEQPLEEGPGELPWRDGALELELRPYEIKTIRLRGIWP